MPPPNTAIDLFASQNHKLPAPTKNARSFPSAARGLDQQGNHQQLPACKPQRRSRLHVEPAPPLLHRHSSQSQRAPAPYRSQAHTLPPTSPPGSPRHTLSTTTRRSHASAATPPAFPLPEPHLAQATRSS